MKKFDDTQMLTILRAVDGVGTTVYDPDVAARGDSSDINAKYGGTVPGSSPERETIIVTRSDQAPQQPGFECPLPGAGDCFERIPREDITETLSFQVDENGASIDGDVNLDSVRGMRLCSIEGLLVVMPSAGPGDMSEYELHQLITRVGWDSEFSIEFRGQKVPGFKDISLAPFIALPGCCDTESICVDCTIPQQGGMEITTNIAEVYAKIGGGVDAMVLDMKLHFSGCGCNCANPNKCGCG